jgi:hypothetical protein
MRRSALGAAAALSVLSSGCLERKIHITSEPPGATVYLNDTEIGRTPVTTGFTYHGDYDVRLRKEGYETVSTHRRAWEPLWEIPPVDLIATALPFTISKEHAWSFDLAPTQPADSAALINRARELRSGMAPSK